MAEKLREHVCPNCGAPLGIPEKHERYFKCSFCGTVLEDHATEEEQQTGVFKIKISQQDIANMRAAQVPVYTAPPVRRAPVVQATPASGRIGCIIAVVVLLFVGGILAVSLVPALLASGAVTEVFGDTGIEEAIDPSGLNGLVLYTYGPTFVLPSDNDTSPDFAGIATGPGSLFYLTYVDFENKPTLRWKAEFSDNEVFWLYNQILADSSRLYLSYENTIVAFNRTQGTQIWESTTSDAIQHNICPGCFQLIGDRVASLAADGTLQVWDAADGTMSWQVRLEGTPRQIVNFGGNPAVLDEINDTVGLKVFNIADGTVQKEIYPACPNYPFPDSPQEVGIYSYLLPYSDGFIFFGGFFDPECAQYWSPGSDEPVWESVYIEPSFSGLDPDQVLMTSDTVFIGSGNGAYSLDLATGEVSILYEDNDYTFVPLGERDGVVLFGADSSRGTRHWEIWALDTALGNIKWTYTPDAKTYFNPNSNIGSLSSDGNFYAGLTSDGLAVAQFFDEPFRMTLQTISVQSGTASPAITMDLAGGTDVTSPGVTLLGWRNNNLWFIDDGNRPVIRVVDATTGNEISTWP